MSAPLIKLRYAWSRDYSQSVDREMEVDYTEPWDQSDIAFLVEGRRIYASKTILAMWSPVMRAMFRDDFKERGAAEIVLPDKFHDDILELVKVLHPPNREVDEGNVSVILPLAREYQMDKLTRRGERFLLSRPASVQSLVLAEEYSLSRLQTQCMDYVRGSKLSTLQEQPDFDMLADKTKVAILCDKSQRYEHILAEIYAIANGHKPDKMQFREGGTMCTFTCPDKDGLHENPFLTVNKDTAVRPVVVDKHSVKRRSRKDEGKVLAHNAGTEHRCKSCTLYMVSRIMQMTNALM